MKPGRKTILAIAIPALAGTLVALPLGLIGFGFQTDESGSGHGAAGYAMLTITLTGPLIACGLLLASRTLRDRATTALLAALVIAYGAWGLLLRAIVHSGVR
jgi:hypothetical protein